MAKNENKDAVMPSNCAPQEDCIPQELEIRDVRLAAAYVPYQKMCTLFSPIDGLKAGTIFPELYSPYEKQDRKKKHFPCK